MKETVNNGIGREAQELQAFVANEILASIQTKQQFMFYGVREIAELGQTLAECLRQGGKIVLFGNGGSAADAQHIAAEFVGRYRLDRQALPAMALTVNSSTLTAIANDYGYEEVFARQIAAFAKAGDIAIGLSTSGNSENVIRGVCTAKSRGLVTVGMTGSTGGKLKSFVDFCVCVPSDVTARIQECHSLLGHILSAYCEKEALREFAVATKG